MERFGVCVLSTAWHEGGCSQASHLTHNKQTCQAARTANLQANTGSCLYDEASKASGRASGKIEACVRVRASARRLLAWALACNKQMTGDGK